MIGGGIAGLSCAWRLQQRGYQVTVLEREVAAGGRMRSETRGPFVIDRGAQFIASAYKNMQALAAEVGLADQIRPLARPKNAVLRKGRLESGDYDRPEVLLRSRAVSLLTKLRLPRLPFELWRHRAVLDPYHPERAAGLDREDMATYVRRILGDEALEYLLGPAISSTFDSDPEDLSGVFLMLTATFAMRGFRLQSFVGGTGRLTAHLAARLDVRVGCEVKELRTDAKGVVASMVTLEGPQTIAADAAVVALPGSCVSGVCATLTAEEQAFFASVRYVRGIIVFLMLADAPAALDYYGIAFPRCEGLDLYGMAVDHHKEGVAPPGMALLNVALTAKTAQRMVESTDDEIIALVLDNLARTPIGRLTPIDAVVHRWDPMLPQFYAGYTQQLAGFATRHERSPRAAFAGDYLIGPYTEMALTSGLRAAEEIEDTI